MRQSFARRHEGETVAQRTRRKLGAWPHASRRVDGTPLPLREDAPHSGS